MPMHYSTSGSEHIERIISENTSFFFKRTLPGLGALLFSTASLFLYAPLSLMWILKVQVIPYLETPVCLAAK